MVLSHLGINTAVNQAQRREVWGLAFVLTLLLAASTYRWVALSQEAAPPGSDGGNWLAFGAELFDDEVKAASAVYPPAFPAMVQGFVLVMSPLYALKVLSLMGAAFVGIGAYLFLRTAVPLGLAGLLAVALTVSDYQTKVLAWGGYPQLFGAAFLLVSVFLFLKGLHEGKAQFFAGAALFMGLTFATHLLATIQLVLAITVAVTVYFYGWNRYLARDVLKERARMALRWLGVAVLLALATFPFYWRMIGLWDGVPSNPQDFNLTDFFAEIGSWHTGTYLWLAAAVVSAPVTAWVVMSRQRMLLADGATAIGVAALVGLVAESEVRSAHLLEIGLVLSMGVVCATMMSGRVPWKAFLDHQWTRYSAGVLVVVFIAGILYFGEQRSQSAFDWYRVVDEPALEALDWIRDHGSSNDKVVANETPRGGIYGWWIEGYAGLPTFFAVDPRWLSFRDEKKQASVAAHLLAPGTAPSVRRNLAESNGIKLLLLDKRTMQTPRSNFEEAGFELSLENESMLVFSYNGEG